MNEYYEYYKTHGICVTCGQEKAKQGRVRCWRCLINQREHEAEYRSRKTDEQKEAAKAKRRERESALRADRREQGLCLNCGRERKNKQYAICDKCRLSAKKSAEKKRLADGRVPNAFRGDGYFCAICLKPVENDGEKLCDRCRANNEINIAKAREAQDNSNHYWRQLANGQYKLYMAKKKWEEEHGDRERV